MRFVHSETNTTNRYVERYNLKRDAIYINFQKYCKYKYRQNPKQPTSSVGQYGYMDSCATLWKLRELKALSCYNTMIFSYKFRKPHRRLNIGDRKRDKNFRAIQFELSKVQIVLWY